MKSKTFTFTILIFAVVFALGALNRRPASASTTSPNTFPQQARGDQPVEQTRKNIQVLKGLPESQLFPLMNFVATSLDVKCDYCHVKNGKNPQTGADNWVWDSDDKPKKLVGRRMMKMVLDINRTNFDGNTFVTCYTCHRGSTIIARLPPLPPHDSVRTEEALPTAEQILAKYVAAVGGKDTSAKFKTTVMKATVERSENRTSQLEVTLKDADKYLITWTTPQSVTAAVVNGEAAWLKSAAGLKQLSGLDLANLRRAAEYYAVIKVVALPEQMKVAGTEKIGGREAYVLSLVVDPDTTKRFYFDKETGLLVRELTTQRTMLAPLPEQVDFEDYRDVDGVKLPFMIRTSNTSAFDTATRRFTEIKHNVAVDDTVFKP